MAGSRPPTKELLAEGHGRNNSAGDAGLYAMCMHKIWILEIKEGIAALSFTGIPDIVIRN